MSDLRKYTVSTYHFDFDGGCTRKDYTVTAYSAEDAWFQVQKGTLRCSNNDYVVDVKPYAEPEPEPEVNFPAHTIPQNTYKAGSCFVELLEPKLTDKEVVEHLRRTGQTPSDYLRGELGIETATEAIARKTPFNAPEYVAQDSD